MSAGKTLFLDFDDTLSAQVPFNLQYARAIGDVLASTYGGDVNEWEKSTIDMLVCLEAEYVARFCDNPLNGYSEWLLGIRAEATRLLFAGMEMPLPPNASEVAMQTLSDALSRCNTLFPGVAEALHTLHSMGYTLYIASGNDSAHLKAALKGVGLDGIFAEMYGPDLVDCAKEGPEFYTRIFAHSEVLPYRALVIDNDPTALRWAMAAGAQAIQVKLLSDREIETVAGIAALVTDIRQLVTTICSL